MKRSSIHRHTPLRARRWGWMVIEGSNSLADDATWVRLGTAPGAIDATTYVCRYIQVRPPRRGEKLVP